MSIVAACSLPARAFALGRALTGESELTVQFESAVPTDQGTLPFFFVWNDDDQTTFRRGVECEAAIESLRVVDRFENGVLYRVEWNAVESEFAGVLAEIDATLLEAVGTSEEWRFELRFADQAALEEFQVLTEELDVSPRLESLKTDHRLHADLSYGLTHNQRQTLILAFERGYFERPREITLEELAEEVGVSSAALNGRLRRGLTNLLSETVMRGRREHRRCDERI